MKIIIKQWETLITKRLHKIEINSDDYPEMKDMSKLDIQNYINENIYSMSAKNSELFDSLHDELIDDFEYDDFPPSDYSDCEITIED
ncbi:hypothetical protein [Winogradskyella poriferorum]|uniref:hypothetical protein n=1 Tax=Winogradskyella poriferorum TaxID=307627 RepID=UPI003D6473F7